MRKTWVKRENIYFKPFYKDKSKIFMLLIFLVGISFIAYQAISLNQLPSVQQLRRKHKEMMQSLGSKQLDVDDFDGGGGGGASVSGGSADLSVPATQDIDSIKIIRGIRLFDYDSYKPNYKGMFKCLDGSREIAFNHLNDNYCDCTDDGSDEPSTNACAKGRFYCKYQKRHITGRGLDVWVWTSRVNDNVCDCCDGSDEWTTNAKCQNKCA